MENPLDFVVILLLLKRIDRMKKINKTTYSLGEQEEVVSVLKIFAVMIGVPIIALFALAWLVT